MFLWNWIAYYKIILSVKGSKRGYHENRWHASGQIQSLMTSHLFFLLSLDFGCSGQWSGWRNCLWQNWLLTMTVKPWSLLFHAQVMILIVSYRFLNHASASVDRGNLYIIIHNSLSWWDWDIGSVPQCGRSTPKSLEVIDAYAYNEYHADSPCVGPWVS